MSKEWTLVILGHPVVLIRYYIVELIILAMMVSVVISLVVWSLRK